MQSDRIEALRKRASSALAAINVLFEEPSADGDSRYIVDIDRREFIILLRNVLQAILGDIDGIYGNARLAARFYEVIDARPDSIDYINRLYRFCGDNGLERNIGTAIMDMAAQEEDFFGMLCSRNIDSRRDVRHRLSHAAELCECCATLIPDYLNALELLSGTESALPRVAPGCYSLLCGRENMFKLPERVSGSRVKKLRAAAAAADPFGDGRTFRYSRGEFFRVKPEAIRPVAKFYGYSSVKNLFEKHFAAFAGGDSNIPLLISSLPGMGKTHFAISYALSFPEMILVLPEPEDLERNLAGLIDRLARRRQHRFVVFFDDIDPRNIDWYYFRTNVGGSATLPRNIIIVAASNYRFPANICSRGREVRFPVFDVNACCGMIYDYLSSLGVRNPKPDLMSVIASDYLEEFGQKVYAELSPRSMVRYLERYDRDPRKRKKMLDMSRERVIPQPDAQMFQDFNVKIIRQLYGEEGIAELRDEMLKGMAD